MQDAALIERIRQKFKALGPVMDELIRRQWAAAEATGRRMGRHLQRCAATDMSHNTIDRGPSGNCESERRGQGNEWCSKRIRRVGGGRKGDQPIRSVRSRRHWSGWLNR